MPVLDLATGHTLEYCQLSLHPKYQSTWNQYHCNKLVRLCQVIGTAPSVTVHCIKVTNTFFIINYEDIPTNRLKEVTYTKVVCELNPHKDEPNRTCITIGGDFICHPGNVGTPTG